MKCSVCGKCFNTTNLLKRHMQCHGVRQQCRLCDQSFSFTTNLRRHESEVHGLLPTRTQTQTTFTCDICDKSFGKKYHLARHRATHRSANLGTSRQTFSCRHCTNDFTNYEQLVEHVEREHPLNQQGGRQRTKSKSLYENGRNNENHKNETQSRNTNVINTDANADESAFQNSVQNRTINPIQNERFDVLTFLANTRDDILTFLRSRTRELGGIKWNLCVQVEMQRGDGLDVITSSPYFRSRTYQTLSVDGISEHDLNEALQKMIASLEQYIREGSGWFVNRVLKLEIHTVVYRPISGSSYISLPATLAKSHSVLNIQNDNDKCFLYCVLASLHPANDFPESAELYQQYENELNMKDIHYPVSISDISRFERQNINISVNVFAFDDGSIIPLRVTDYAQRTHHVNMLLLKNAQTTHYCLITDLNRFLSRTKTRQNRLHFCPYCLHGFKRDDLLKAHQPLCSTHGPQKVELPLSEKEAILKFKEYEKTLKVPFVIYADFETVNVKLHTCAPNPEQSGTFPTTKLEVCGYGYKVVCEDERYTKPTVVYRGPNAAKKLVQSLLEEQKIIEEILTHIEPMKVRPEHRGLVANAVHCCLCRKEFTAYDRASKKIVIHHNHLTGEIIGVACNDCNLNCKQAKFTCVMFHNLRNFDAHILCETLGEFKEHKLTCIAQNSERYVSFSLGGLRFLDSFQFLPSSLETLVGDLKQDGLEAFQHTQSEFEQEHAELLIRKGVYPYDYMDSFERFDEPMLPPIEAFYSSLKRESIAEEDYTHAQTVFREFDMRSLGDYHDLYLKTDVLLLCDVFESFRTVCLQQYELDPCQYYTSPGLSWSSLLKMTGVELELIMDIDQMLMIEAGIRGGLSQISNRYKRANNPYLDEYDSSQRTSYLQYLDANNLYGWAMVQPLPVGDFRFLEDVDGFDVMNVPENGDKGYILEVSLHYPPRLHDLHNCLPLAPEQQRISNEQLSPYAQRLLRQLHGLEEYETLPSRGQVGKLLATLADKDNYVIHYRNLQLYVRLGLEIKTIHRILQFRQEPWMKPYIDFNTDRRKHATSMFQKNFYKLMNFSVFGKTMENVRKHRSIELVHREERLQKLSAKPTYKHTTIFSEDLAAVELLRSKVKLHKPSYSGMCILDLSKYLMYDFWYNYIKRRYGSSAQLQMTDTDSLLFYCETRDIYEDMSMSMEEFDTSEYPKNHPLQSDQNKKALGKMKDETKGFPISEFVGLRSKMYSFLCNQKEEKRAKGVAQVTVKKDISHEQYKKCLFREKQMISSMSSLRSHKHELYCDTVQKTGLSAFDDKRYLINNIESYAYGHFKIAGECTASRADTQFSLVEDDFYMSLEEGMFETLDQQSFVIAGCTVTPCMKK